MILNLILAAAVAAIVPVATTAKPPATCVARLAVVERVKAVAEVKLEEETERADAQIYLTRLELTVTKQRLAAALAKCGAPCAAPASAAR